MKLFNKNKKVKTVSSIAGLRTKGFMCSVFNGVLRLPCSHLRLNSVAQDKFARDAREFGFTLIELIMSLAIMGMIIFVINVILISVIKSSARTDTKIRLGNYIETAYEIIERNVKSAEPSSICIADYNESEELWYCVKGETTGDALMMNLLSDLKTTVVFYYEKDENDVGILKSYWIKYNSDGDITSITTTYLSSPGEIDIETFEADVAVNYQSGIHQVILRTLSDSIDNIGIDDPLVNDMLRSVTIVTRGKEI